MQFNSWISLFFYQYHLYPITLLINILEKKAGYVSLLTSNIVFYGYASIEFLVFLILVSLVNYLLIKTIVKYKNKFVLIYH